MQMGGYHKLWKGVVFNMKIGFIGLGRMGRGACENFVKKGHDVAVYDVSADAMEYFRGKAELAFNPADLNAVRRCFFHCHLPCRWKLCATHFCPVV